LKFVFLLIGSEFLAYRRESLSEADFAVGKYEQDAKGAAFPTGAYIDVRDQGETQTRQSIAKYFIGKKDTPRATMHRAT
jgi:hypothetical protein